MCILFVHTLLKVVSYYDLSVLSMSVMGFQRESFDGVGGWGELYPSLFWIFGFFKLCNAHNGALLSVLWLLVRQHFEAVDNE